MKINQLKEWLRWRWYRRNQKKLRNIAAWAMHHHAGGGAHDANSVLLGQADKRIFEAACGDLGRTVESVIKDQPDAH